MKPLFNKKTKCYVCGNEATAIYHLKPVCGRCYQKLKYFKKRDVNINHLIELQKKVKKEFNLKYKNLSRSKSKLPPFEKGGF